MFSNCSRRLLRGLVSFVAAAMGRYSTISSQLNAPADAMTLGPLPPPHPHGSRFPVSPTSSPTTSQIGLLVCITSHTNLPARRVSTMPARGPSGPWQRLKPVDLDPLESMGLPSKGETRYAPELTLTCSPVVCCR